MNKAALFLSLIFTAFGSLGEVPRHARVVSLLTAAFAVAIGIYSSLGAPTLSLSSSPNAVIATQKSTSIQSPDLSRQSQILADDSAPRMDEIVLKAERAAAASSLSHQADDTGYIAFQVGDRMPQPVILRYAGAAPSLFTRLRCIGGCARANGISGLGVATGNISGYPINLEGVWIEGYLRAGELSVDVKKAGGAPTRCVYRGQFNRDTNLPEGEGRTRIDGLNVTYSGQMMSGVPSGYGVLTSGDGHQVKETMDNFLSDSSQTQPKFSSESMSSYDFPPQGNDQRNSKDPATNPFAPFAAFCAKLSSAS